MGVCRETNGQWHSYAHESDTPDNSPKFPTMRMAMVDAGFRATKAPTIDPVLASGSGSAASGEELRNCKACNRKVTVKQWQRCHLSKCPESWRKLSSVNPVKPNAGTQRRRTNKPQPAFAAARGSVDERDQRLMLAEEILSDLATGYWVAVLDDNDDSVKERMGQRILNYWRMWDSPPPSNCYPVAREGTDADGAGVAQRLSLEAHLPRLPDNDPDHR
jgi:hypothetical protein